jgi:hypothetical protein
MTVVCLEVGEREQGEISFLSLSPLLASIRVVIHSSLHTHNDTRGTCESRHPVIHRSVDECSELRLLTASFLVLLESLRCIGAAADGGVCRALSPRWCAKGEERPAVPHSVVLPMSYSLTLCCSCMACVALCCIAPGDVPRLRRMDQVA